MLNNLLLYIFFQFILVKTKCNKAIRVLIVEKLKNGIGQRETARNLGISKTTVQNIWKRFVEEVWITWKDCGSETHIKSCSNQKAAFLLQVVFVG